MSKQKWSTRLLSLGLSLAMTLSLAPAAFAAEASGDVTLTPDTAVEEVLPGLPETPTVPETPETGDTPAPKEQPETGLAGENYDVSDNPVWNRVAIVPIIKITGNPHIGETVTAELIDPEFADRSGGALYWGHYTTSDASDLTVIAPVNEDVHGRYFNFVMQSKYAGKTITLFGIDASSKTAFLAAGMFAPADANEIGGTVKFEGKAEYNSTITVNVDDVWPVEARANLVYSWGNGTLTDIPDMRGAKSYTFVASDLGKKFTVSVSAGEGFTSPSKGALTAQTGVVVVAPLSGKVYLKVNGTQWTTGSQIVVDRVVFDQPELNLREQKLKYSWYLNGKDVGGGASLLLDKSTIGDKKLSVTVTPQGWIDYAGELRLEQDITILDVPTPINGKVAIKGDMVVGTKLAVDATAVSPAWVMTERGANVSWLRNGVQVATGEWYTLTKEDVGTEITVRLNGLAEKGFSGELTSSARGTVVENFVITAPGKMTTIDGNVIKVTEEKGTPVATITMTTWDGRPLNLDEIEVGTKLRLKTEAESGFLFSRWDFTPLKGWTQEELTAEYQFGEQRPTTTDTPLYVTVTKLGVYSAYFAPDYSGTESDVKLGSLQVIAPEGRQLVQKDGTYGFDPKIGDYTLYMLENEVDLKILIGRNSLNQKVTVNRSGTSAHDEPVVFKEGSYVSDPITLYGSGNYFRIRVYETIDGVEKQSECRLQIEHVNSNPQLAVSMAAYGNRNVASITVRVNQAAFLAGDFALTLKDDLTVDGTAGSGFAGFCDKQGNLLQNGLQSGDNKYYKSDSINVDYMNVTDGGKSITVAISSAMNEPLMVFDSDGYILMRFYALKSPASIAAQHGNDQLVPAAMLKKDSVEGANTMYEARFGQLRYRETMPPSEYVVKSSAGDEPIELAAGEAIPVPEADRLIHFKPEDFYDVVLFVNGRPNEKRMRYNLHRTEFDEEVKLTDIMDPLEKYGMLLFEDIEGLYRIEIVSKGYLSHDVENIKITKTPLGLGSITLIGGDVNDDGIIDINDRTDLIKVIGGTVVADKGAGLTYEQGGYVLKEVDGLQRKIYADLNDDGYVNALDLGVTLRGIALMGK